MRFGAVVCVLAFMLAGQSVALPQLLTSGVANVDLVLLLSAVYAPLTVRCFAGEALALEASAQRRLDVADLALFAAIFAPVGVTSGMGAVTGDSAFALDLVRDVAMFAAAALVLFTIAGSNTAAALPVGYVLLIAVLGANSDGSSPWWATLRQPATPAETVAALCLATGGLVIFHRWARHRPHAQVNAADCT